jgi:hypothetical protein
MTDQNESKTNFAATYFEKDSILRLARLADIFAWVALAYYATQALVAAAIFILQIARGLAAPAGFTDYAQQLIWMLQPVIPGLLNFLGIQAIGKFLLILMDVEDNLRRIARSKS